MPALPRRCRSSRTTNRNLVAHASEVAYNRVAFYSTRKSTVNATSLADHDCVARAMRFCVAAALLMAGASAQAGLSFQMNVATHNQPGTGTTTSRPEHERVTSQVVLGERHIAVVAPADAQIYDFSSRRRYRVDLKDSTFVDYSLFDTVGFRVMEVKNRENLRRTLAAAQIDQIVFDPVFDEHALSLASSTQRTLDERADGPETILSIDGKPLMKIAAGGTAVSASDAALFTRYVRYQFGGHPLVLAKLAALRRVPSTFVMYYASTGGTETSTFTVSGMTLAAADYEMGKYSPRSGGDEIDLLLDRAQLARVPALEKRRQAHDAEMNTAFADKRTLDGMLGAAEWHLMTGAPMERFTAERLAMIQADPSVRAVGQAMNPRDKAGLLAAARVMQSMQAQTMSKRYILQLFEANHRVKLGERSAALKLFASVLRANPALAGAYKDMGDTLIAGFDMPRAWRAWDQGRRIAPGHGLFESVNQFEQKLMRDHPEYF
jgi:hypothetical protein